MKIDIGEYVCYGEIDNRDRNTIKARIWFRGFPTPAEIMLRGNCLRDLAGHAVSFYNPFAERGEYPIQPVQDGVCGEVTLERSYQVNAAEGGGETVETKGLYFEWFSQQNARVVVAIPHVMASGSRQHWQMTGKQELAQQKANRQILQQFQACVDKVAKQHAAPEEIEEKQLRKVDRTLNQILRIEKLREEAGGAEVLGHAPGSQPTSLDDEEDFYTGLVAVDSEQPSGCSHWEHLAEAKIYPRKTSDVPDEDIQYELWRLVYALAMLGVFVDSTDHLSDRQLYDLIMSKILVKDAMFPPGIGWNTHFPVYELESENYQKCEEIYMRYYLDDEERKRWHDEFPEDRMPEHEDPPYTRDCYLPTGYETTSVE